MPVPPDMKHCLRVDIWDNGKIVSSHAFLGSTKEEARERYEAHLEECQTLKDAIEFEQANPVWMEGS